LTRIDVHPDGYVVSPNTDRLFDFPWLYAVEVGDWTFNEDQASRMREHLLRGGFLMVDDFHGEYEWTLFAEGLRMIFPDRPIEDIPGTDAIYSLPYEIGNRMQVPGPGYMRAVHELALDKPGALKPVEYDQLVADLVNYMTFMSEPARDDRITTGLYVLIVISILVALTYALKKEYWKDVH